METVRDFLFWGSKIPTDGDCNHEIKRCLLLGRKVMTNLDNILKSRDITLPTKVHLVNNLVFPIVMYGYRAGNGNPFQCFCLEKPMDRRAWWATVHVVTKSWTQLSTHEIANSLRVRPIPRPRQAKCLEYCQALKYFKEGK